MIKPTRFTLLLALLCPISADYSYTKFYYDYECNEPLLRYATLTATSSMRDRTPDNAKFDGINAWSAAENDFEQQLIIDLKTTKNVTRIVTQGRVHSNEFVEEYGISYGSNGRDYAHYKEPGGEIKVFVGNKDSDTLNKNEFEVPIIAQYIRINPTRWHDRISMRVELYGCDYVADVISFNGSSLIRSDLLREPIAALQETIRFRFKTSTASGVLLYSRGTQGDLVALQLRDNKLLLNIDLGSGEPTSFSAGSLLDDNIWHDVVVSRSRKNIVFSVDRVLVTGIIKGEFNRLDLNRELYIGGVPNIQQGLVVGQNFTGCIENMYLNATNIIKKVKDVGQSFVYQRVNTLYTCPEPPVVPVTFLTQGSYAKLKGYEGGETMNISLQFRTYEKDGLLIYHDFRSKGYVKVYLDNGKVKVELNTNNSPRMILDNYDEEFNDGRWHSVVLTMAVNSLVLSVDFRPVETVKKLKFSTGAYYFIAGRTNNPHSGFVGCMRLISVDGNYRLPTDWRSEEYCCSNEVVFDACQMTDRCSPNPCEHGGVCKQQSSEFWCDCSGTGYTGAICHASTNSLSCQAHKNLHPGSRSANIEIDVDGSGPLPPFPVTCEFYADGRVLTAVHHEMPATTTVDGFQEPGSFRQDIVYKGSREQIEALLNRSETCFQRLSYSCKSSRLLNSPSDADNFQPFGWWVSRDGQQMDYWAGGLPGSRKCQCGVLGNCADPSKWCNCDAEQFTFTGQNKIEFREDAGEITDKEYLPVKQVRFGDTGTHLDEKEGRYTLGPLMCEGDDLFKNVVTFRISDATIDLPTFDMGHSGDIYFEFKTTKENAVLLHSTGLQDYIKLSIIGGNQLQFRFQAGNGDVGVTVETSNRLSNNEWHSVYVERNRKEARVEVDGVPSEVRTPPGPVRALQLTSRLVVGAAVDYADGYVGCLRALLLNGRRVDLEAYAKRGLYGVSVGCRGMCESSPCLNNGTCAEGYDGYSCDCRYSAFKGPICADEIGVNLRPNSMIKYNFDKSWRSTIDENIRVGFTTTNPKGFLLGFYSNISAEYLTIMVSNSGHLRVVFDFGFERQEIIYPNKHFALGQFHDVRLRRKNGGSTLTLQVDDSETMEYHFDIKASADAQFNNIQYIYIGRNETMQEGFVGCVSRVQFDDFYPLKLLFQQSGSSNVHSLGGPLNEDFCGVEPVTHPPPVVETRPPPRINQDTVNSDYHKTDEAILGSVLGVLFLLLVVVGVVLVRALSRHKGEYLTQEERGADGARDPDAAALAAATGPRVTKRHEIFI